MHGVAREKKVVEAGDYRARLYDRYRSGLGIDLADDDRASRAPYLRRLIAEHFPQNLQAKMLDLGCGSGTFISFLKEAGYANVTGIDTSLEQVIKAQALNIPGVKQGDLFDTLQDADAESLDVIIAFDVIEHMTKPELLTLADEIYRVLKPQGRWVIHAPNAEAPFGACVRYADWTHEQAFTKESLNQVLKAVGFSRVQCYEDQPVVHGLKSALRWVMWKICRGAIRIYWMAETGATGRDCIFSRNLLAIAIKD
jgi:SAM-dependent methyltransferase